MNEREYKQLKAKAAEAQKAQDKAEGQLEAVLTQMSAQYGCATMEEAEDLLVVLERDTKKVEAQYEKAVATFKEEWSEHFDD